MLRVGTICLAIAWAFLATAEAQDGDYQLRILLHKQFVAKERHTGVAGWIVLQNLMNKASERQLLLFGAVYKADKRWLEVMAGGLVSRNEPASFLLDVRYADRGSKWLSSFIETMYNFRTRSFLLSPSATSPMRVKRVRFRVGLEGDFTFAAKSKTAIAGPRVVFPLPICRSFCKELSLISAYRFQSDGRRVVRNYLAFNF